MAVPTYDPVIPGAHFLCDVCGALVSDGAVTAIQDAKALHTAWHALVDPP